MPTAKEKIYDKQINPLMAKVIAICKKHKIAMLADFALGFEDDDSDGQLKCTTVLLDDDTEPCPEQLRASRILMGERGSPMMLTVRDGDGNIKESHAIIP